MISVIDLTNHHDVSRLKQFSALDHPSTFRYFKNRVFEDAIKTHKLTVVYSVDNKDVGYAHIDVDTKTQRAFFGICVLPDYQSKGIGKQLTDYVMQTYRDTVYLTVDSANTPAIGLYKKFGFELVESYASSGLWIRSL
jgi:ribosomal protein S18 acetylase RimI-like enzyme